MSLTLMYVSAYEGTCTVPALSSVPVFHRKVKQTRLIRQRISLIFWESLPMSEMRKSILSHILNCEVLAGGC